MNTILRVSPSEAELERYSCVIDVRSPGEFAADHLPGAVNLPVLDNAERAVIGTVYKRVSHFEARRRGAALIAANVARHLEGYFAERGGDFFPLLYCWRGGFRSMGMALILQSVGWRVAVIDGGYKEWRRYVMGTLADLCKRFRWVVISGLTGVGKTRLLRTLEGEGAQVLDLEALACHRGSLLGGSEEAQPSQCLFESRLHAKLSAFSGSHPVFVEAESSRVGKIHLPPGLRAAMDHAPGIEIVATMDLRVRWLLEDYREWLASGPPIEQLLRPLARMRGHAVVDEWVRLATAGDWERLARALLEQHYDPAYRCKFAGQRRRMLGAVSFESGGVQELSRVAGEIRAKHGM